MRRVLIVGTGLIGASVGLALKAAGFAGTVVGWDASEAELADALAMGAIEEALKTREDVLATEADVIVLATPVMAILDWMQKLATVVGEDVLITDVGSTKGQIVALGEALYNRSGRAKFLAGHPMAGKESGGAKLAEAGLFSGATWLFCTGTGGAGGVGGELEGEWRGWVSRFGAEVLGMEAERHDVVCAWVSHLPQMVSTAMSAMLEDEFAGDEVVGQVGGRALREMTRLGSSPYSMWRDVAMTNTENVAAVLWALEQRLAYVRENLRTPELRAEFWKAREFKHES